MTLLVFYSSFLTNLWLCDANYYFFLFNTREGVPFEPLLLGKTFDYLIRENGVGYDNAWYGMAALQCYWNPSGSPLENYRVPSDFFFLAQRYALSFCNTNIRLSGETASRLFIVREGC